MCWLMNLLKRKNPKKNNSYVIVNDIDELSKKTIELEQSNKKLEQEEVLTPDTIMLMNSFENVLKSFKRDIKEINQNVNMLNDKVNVIESELSESNHKKVNEIKAARNYEMYNTFRNSREILKEIAEFADKLKYSYKSENISIIDSLYDEIYGILQSNNVELMNSESEYFDYNCQLGVAVEKCDQKDMDGKIFKILGDSYFLNGELLSRQKVITYKFEEEVK